MNDLTINPKKTDERYKCLGQDENISYVGPINKDSCERIYKKSEKIWTSELSAYNKHIAHIAFDVLSRCQYLLFLAGPYKRLNTLP